MGKFIDYNSLKEQIEKSGDLKNFLFSVPDEVSSDVIRSGTVSISSSGLTTALDTLPSSTLIVNEDTFPPSTLTVNGKTIEELIDERVEQYKELMRLQALGCKNCGGSINKETMTCEYCGTSYAWGGKPKDKSWYPARYMSF